MKHGSLFVIAAGSILAAALSVAEAQTAAPGTAPNAQVQPAQGQWQQAHRDRDDFANDRDRGEWQDVRNEGINREGLNHVAPGAMKVGDPTGQGGFGNTGNTGNTGNAGGAAANLATADRDVATDRADIRADRRDIRQDKGSLRTDRRDLRHDYALERAGDNEQTAIRDERGQIRSQARDIRQDEASLRSTEQNLRTESQDVRDDRADLPRTDQSGWHAQSGWHSQALTPTTLARNSAEEKKSPTRTASLHQAWYHYFW